jgi:hypothetical protein
MTSIVPNDLLAVSIPAWRFCGWDPSNESTWLAEPNSLLPAGTVLWATVMLPIAAATETVRSVSTKSC